MDYRGLDARTSKNVYPIPRISNDFGSLAGLEWSMCVELKNGL